MSTSNVVLDITSNEIDEETKICNIELQQALKEHYKLRLHTIDIALNTIKNNPYDKELFLQKVGDVIKVYKQYSDFYNYNLTT